MDSLPPLSANNVLSSIDGSIDTVFALLILLVGLIGKPIPFQNIDAKKNLAAKALSNFKVTPTQGRWIARSIAFLAGFLLFQVVFRHIGEPSFYKNGKLHLCGWVRHHDSACIDEWVDIRVYGLTVFLSVPLGIWWIRRYNKKTNIPTNPDSL